VEQTGPAKTIFKHLDDLLEKARITRLSLQIAATFFTTLAGVLKIAIPATWPANVLMVSNVVQILSLILAVACGVVVLATDKSALSVLSDAKAALDKLEEKKQENQDLEETIDDLRRYIEWSDKLNMITDTMRVAVDLAIQDEDTNVNHHIEEMLDLLASNKQGLFSMGDEQWNFSVYVFDEEKNQLLCVACRRPARNDEQREHRAWRPGEGHIGQSFLMKRPLVVADSKDPNVRGFFDAPRDKLVAGYDDSDRYRSLAAIPFGLAGSADPIGVVVATSDVPGRFAPTDDGTDSDAVRPISALSKTLATLTSVTNMKLQLEKHDG
jgi:hypothetical protein